MFAYSGGFRNEKCASGGDGGRYDDDAWREFQRTSRAYQLLGCRIWQGHLHRVTHLDKSSAINLDGSALIVGETPSTTPLGSRISAQ